LTRSSLLLFLSAALVASPSLLGSLDPAFEKVPFDRWLGTRDPGLFHWSVQISRPELSFHQRFVSQVQIKLDGRDLATRRNDGRLVFLVQITDTDGNRYQSHGSIELAKLDENIKAANLEYSQRAFVLPGDYRLAVAILDTTTGEHSAKQLIFRVPPPPRDPLTSAGRDLPPVEFVGEQEPPDGWYLPDVRGRLSWSAFPRINIILNVESHRTQGSELAALLPTLKAISPLAEHIELLDLARRRAMFQQNGVHDLDWPTLKASLGDASTSSIDVHSLAERHHDAQFFVSETRRLLRSSQEPCVLVVLASPVAFESGEDLAPISQEALPSCYVVYIRYHPPAQALHPPLGRQMGGRGPGSRFGGPIAGDRRHPNPPDQLAATLKPLKPKVFDVDTPEQMSKAIAEIQKAHWASSVMPIRTDR
jgi:hypothetical protein